MPYLILFEDNPEADPAIRNRLMPDHLAFLAAQDGAVIDAGPLFAADVDGAGDGAGRGGAWVVDVPDAKAAHALVRADPFWPTGLRARVTVLDWRQVFRAGRVV